MTQATHTCATCPFARHLDGDRYVCTAVHNHHNNVVRGHWEATSDCISEAALKEQQAFQEKQASADVDYAMRLEAALEKAEAQAQEQRQFSQVAATIPSGIEIDSIKPDVYRIWAGTSLLGTMRRTSKGWMARPDGGQKSWHATPDRAQQAVIEASLTH